MKEGTRMKKIMIVDDDVTSVAIVKALLEPEFEVVSANTGVEALGKLQRSPDLNLILLDMVMPGDHVTITVKLIYPVAINEGLRFAIREGGRTVGAGQILKILA